MALPTFIPLDEIDAPAQTAPAAVSDNIPTMRITPERPAPSPQFIPLDALEPAAPSRAPKIVQPASPQQVSRSFDDNMTQHDLMRHFEEASKETDIPVSILVAMGKQESGLRPDITGPTGGRGILQIQPSTAAKPGFGVEGVNPDTLFDAGNNIRFGARYLAALARDNERSDPSRLDRLFSDANGTGFSARYRDALSKNNGKTDWNNPEHVAAALMRYNGGGDPNYVANVGRHYGDAMAFPKEGPGRYYASLLPMSVDETTGEKKWGIEENGLVRSLARGFTSFSDRLNGGFTPDSIKGLTPDEIGAFTTFGGMPRAGTMTNATGEMGPVTKMVADRINARDTRLGSAPEQTQALEIANAARQEVKAGKQVSKRLEQDLNVEGKTPTEILEELKRGDELGKPLALVDVGGKNIHGLAGAAARAPGESKAIFNKFFEGRDEGAGARLTSDVARDLTQGPSARRTTQGLQQLQTQEAVPLYEKAFEGGSMAPLQRQLENTFADLGRQEKEIGTELTSARQQLNSALGRQSQAGNVYSTSGANEDVRAAQAAVTAAENKLNRVSETKAQATDIMRLAQDDAATGKPGAVWNPRIQQFLDDPIVKNGLKQGLEDQRLDALADYKRFDPTEYAITDKVDEAGNPIVAKVPNMRTLNAIKIGLDAIIQAERKDGRLTQHGLMVNRVKQAFVKELDNINPDYATARASWQGNAASQDAVKFGKNLNKYSPEEVKDFVSGLSESDKEFMRLGVADNVLERVLKTSLGGDEAKHVIKSEWSKGQLAPVFKTEADFKNFVDSVAAERLMFNVRQIVQGNSASAERAAEDLHNVVSTGAAAARGIAHTISGHIPGAIISAIQTIRYLGLRPKPELNAAIARLMVDNNIDIRPGPNGKLIVSGRTPLLDKEGKIIHRADQPRGFASGGHVNNMAKMTPLEEITFRKWALKNKIPPDSENGDSIRLFWKSTKGGKHTPNLVADDSARQGFAEGGSVNSKYVREGNHNYNTKLSADQERAFRNWVNTNKVPFDTDAGVTDYDMRGFWSALSSGDKRATSAIDPHDKQMHYPDYWKTPLHETFSRESQWATPDAPYWNDADELTDSSGNVLFSPTKQKYAEGGIVEADNPSTAEPQLDTDAQMQAVQDPQAGKDTMFIAKGSEYPQDIPVGTIIVRRPEGDLVTTSLEKAAEFLQTPQLTDQSMAALLGYPEAKSEVTDPVVVQGVEPSGGVSTEMLSSPDKTEEAVKAVLKQSPTAALGILSPDQAQQRRRVAMMEGMV